MRSVAWTMSLLLLLVPLGLAQDGDPSGGSSSTSSSTSTSQSPTSDAPAPCDSRGGRPGAGGQGNGNQSGQGNGSQSGNATCEPRPAPPAREGCRDGVRSDDEAAQCERQVRRIGDERGRDWISFQVDAANATLLDYTIAGLLALERMHIDLDEGNLSIGRVGATLHVRDGDAELRLHDIPTGLIRFKGDDGNVTLAFPAGAALERHGQGGRMAYAGGREGHLFADNATWLNNDTVQLNGFFSFHVPARGAPAAAELPAKVQEAEERKDEARERGRIGAEVNLRARPEQASLASLDASVDESVEILAYDDVEVTVDAASLADPDAPIRVVVSSELAEGRTIVLNVDETLLASTDPADLVLRYFDVYNRTDGSVYETEVVFAAASSLQDVLEPMDDGGQPEYWVVEDANGVQILVSVPHWSVHAITVASIATAFTAPNVAVGIVAGAAASLVMGVLLFLPRRRDDEL